MLKLYKEDDLSGCQMKNGATKVGIIDELAFRFFGRLIAKQFVVFGGVSSALARGAELLRQGIVPTYNRVDEHVRFAHQIDQIILSYITLIEKMDCSNCGHIALKPSAFGIERGTFVFVKSLKKIIDSAKGKSLEIEVDAESREMLSCVQVALNALARQLPDGIVIRPAFQMHLPNELHNKLVSECRIHDMPLRIVKGSGLYNDGEQELDEQQMLQRYIDTFRMQICRGIRPKVATIRDAKLLESLEKIALAENISATQFFIQFLDGPFGKNLARRCVKMGYQVGCYVTFVDPSAPDAWRGYVRRRIAFGRQLLFNKCAHRN